MDKQGFRDYLIARNVPEDQLAPALALADRFEAYLAGKPTSADIAWDFSRLLIQEGRNSEANYYTLFRYCRYIHNHELYVAFLELVDGGEVAGNLYRKVAKTFGKKVRDEVFAGIGVAPYGTPTIDKPAYLQPVLKRLEVKIGKAACSEFLSSSLRTLPNRYYLEERRKYRQAGGIDAFLHQRKIDFLAQLETCLRENRPFFAQEITQEVIDFVRDHPEMGGGRRVGNIVYETKIPFMTHKYLEAKDPLTKRYQACHCPWAREAVLRGDVPVADTFCNCSGGFHKKPFEVIFRQPLKVVLIASVLRGNDHCRFAILLPEEAIPV